MAFEFNKAGNFIGAQATASIASRQVLSFLRLPTSEAGKPAVGKIPITKRAFAVSSLVEGALKKGPQVINWKTREIFDIDERLVFRDHYVRLSGNNELRVRTAVNDLLRVPVWSVKAGPFVDFEALALRTVAALHARPGPKLIPDRQAGESAPRLICYSYPRMGILCSPEYDASRKVIVDIGDLRVKERDVEVSNAQGESVNTAWSPYDLTSRATAGEAKDLWQRRVAALPDLPEGGAVELTSSIAAATSSVLEERTLNPELQLVGQQTDVYCAIATGLMILGYHKIVKTQDEIATAMRVAADGATNDNQIYGYHALSDNSLEAVLDDTASFDEGAEEIRQNRPFKSAIPGHARACCGYKIESGDKRFLYIYDPWPVGQGEIYYEDWSSVYHTNYVYVRPRQFS